MPKLVIASALARWLATTSQSSGEVSLSVEGGTVGEALNQLFELHPSLRGYVVDERGALRHHVALFVDGEALQPKSNLGLAVDAQSEIYLLQALSGG